VASLCVATECSGYGQVRITGIVPQGESEPNNVFASASVLSMWSSVDSGPVAAVAASLASPYDVDVFRVDVSAEPIAQRYLAEIVAQRIATTSGLLSTLERVEMSDPATDGVVLQRADRCERPVAVDPCLLFTVPAARTIAHVHLRVKARGNSAGRYALVLRRL
jgi:hypothetical protein